MPRIIPIRDLKDTNKISEMVHERKEPIFVTKNGYSELVVMSSELYDELYREYVVDQAIARSIEQIKKGQGRPAEEVFAKLDKMFNEEV